MQALSNTCEILDKVEQYTIDHAPIMPFFPIPEEFGTERRGHYGKNLRKNSSFEEFTRDENGNVIMSHEGEKKIKKLGRYDKMDIVSSLKRSYLAKLAYDGARHIYGDPLPDEVSRTC